MYVICYFVGKIVGNYVFPRCRFDRVFMFACNLSCMIYCIKFTNWLLLTKSNTVRKILAIKNLVIFIPSYNQQSPKLVILKFDLIRA